jgi:succinyl-diaminopimelate desuccinylase
MIREIIRITRDLIGFKSVHTHPREIRRCADYVEKYFRAGGMEYQRFDFEGVPSLLVLPSEGYAPVLLMSHMDVVDAPDHLFLPVEKDGRLYGRGSLDDKYAVALSMVLAGEALRKLRSRGKGQRDLPFGLLITGDEETGGNHGAKRVLDHFKTDFCIALDGGNPKKIVIREKGTLRLQLISRGKSAHGSRPWLGENAIEKLMEDYQAIKVFFDLPETPDHWHRTLNFSIVRAGTCHNQVPDYAEGLLDIRYTEDDPLDELIQRMREAIQGELIVRQVGPLFHGGESPYLDLLLEIAGDACLGSEHGASDARYLSARGVRGIVWGPEGGESQHSLHEHVEVESVHALYRILHRFMERVESSFGLPSQTPPAPQAM